MIYWETYDDLSNNTVVLRFHVDCRFVSFLQYCSEKHTFRLKAKVEKLTISKRTSPAVNDSPSVFFH